MARFETEKVPYNLIKRLLKQSILAMAKSPIRQEIESGLMRMALHNLAILNYLEIELFNEQGDVASLIDGIDKVSAHRAKK